MEKKPRKVSPAGAKAKGNAAESLFVRLMTELGVPSVKVVGSGKFFKSGVGADAKVGVPLVDGNLPKSDESGCIHRAECKHHAVNPNHLFENVKNTELEPVMTICASPKKGTEKIWGDLNQNAQNNVLALRRARAVAKGGPDDMFVVVMPITEYAKLLKLAYPDMVAYVHGEDKA